MAQQSGQSPHPNWDTPSFLSPFFNTSISPGVNAPSSNNGVNALLSNNNGHGQYPSAKSTLFPGHADISSSSQQGHTLQAPFTTNSVNETNSTVERQGEELIKIILDQVMPAVKRETKDEILQLISVLTAKIKQLEGEMGGLKGEVGGLKSVVAEIKGLMIQLATHEHQHPFIRPNKTPQ